VPDPRGVIPAIVLAAGLSKRMGRNKLLIEIQGKPMLHWVLDALLAAGTNDIIVVTGHEEAQVETSCSGYGVRLRFVHNPNYSDGRSTSIQTGLAALPTGCTAVRSIPGDVPFVKSALIRQLMDKYNESGLITFPLVGERKGHPVIFPSSAFHLLRELQADQTLHDYLLANPDQTHPVACDDQGCLQDFDAPIDLLRFQRQRPGPQPD